MRRVLVGVLFLFLTVQATVFARVYRVRVRSYRDSVNSTPSGGKREALSFDGTNDTVDIVDSGDFNLRLKDYSWEFFIQIQTQPTLDYGYMIASHDHGAGTNTKWIIGYGKTVAGPLPNVNGPWMHIQDGGTGDYMFLYAQAGAPLSTNVWHHLAYTRVGATGEFHIFLDGTRLTTEILASVFPAPAAVVPLWNYDVQTPTANVILGYSPTLPTQYFLGELAGFHITTSVKYSGASYTVPNMLGLDANTIVLFPFTEGSGGTLNDSGTLNHDGTINGPTWVYQ